MLDFHDKNLALNEQLFDKYELFETVENELRKHHIEADDFKANISGDVNEAFAGIPGSFDIYGTFSWIFYEDSVPASQFKTVAQQIEKFMREAFGAIREINCIRYRGTSLYSEHGYDVEMEIRFTYPLCE